MEKKQEGININREKKQTKIILIGGVAGTGKTTIARELVYRYGIYQRIGTGFIREIVKNETSYQDKKETLDCHTYRVSCQQPYNHLAKQADCIKDAINCCINRAHREGTSLVMEGNHCLPWLLDNPNITHSFILFVDDEKIHRKLLSGKSHKLRKITDEEFGRIKEMQESLIFLAEENNIPLIEAGRDLKVMLENVEKVIK